MSDKKIHLMLRNLIVVFIFYVQGIEFCFLIRWVYLELMFKDHKEEIVKYHVLENDNFYK